MAQSLDSLDAVCALILKCKSVSELQKELIPALKKLDKSSSGGGGGKSTSSILEGALVDGSDPLVTLSPAESSVGYLFVLNARVNAAAGTDLGDLWDAVEGFTTAFDAAQLRLVPEQVTFFARQLSHIAEASRDPTVAIQPLKNLVQRLAPPGVLTAVHPLFLQLVLYSRMYEDARELLSVPIDDVDTSIYPLKYQDHLAYHYIGGTLLALLGQPVRASAMLEICVTAPGPGTSAIQLDAYKKLTLIQLLAYGKTVPLAPYASTSTVNTCKNAAGPYIEYAAAYVEKNKAKLAQLVETHREVFEKDHNYGLVLQCQAALRRRTIQNLTETFVSMSIADLAAAVDLPMTEAGLQEAEAEVRGMLASGEVHGAITPSPHGPADLAGMTVTFVDDPEPYNSHLTVQRVTAAIAKAAQLEASLVGRDLALGRSKEFVTKAYNSAGATNSALGGTDDLDVHMNFDYGEGTDDE